MSSLLAQYSSDGLSRNLREMCWGGNNNFVSRAGGGGKKRKRPLKLIQRKQNVIAETKVTVCMNVKIENKQPMEP